jgi:hypothetical protein
MIWVLAYSKENEKYSWLNKERASDKHAERIVKKVSRHFKLGVNHTTFKNLHVHAGLAKKFWNEITMIHNPNLLTIAHELNHFLIWKKYPDRKINHGSKKWFRSLEKIIKYCEKKSWWRKEERRLDDLSKFF